MSWTSIAMCKTQLPFCPYVMGIVKKQPVRTHQNSKQLVQHIGDIWGMKHGLCFNLIESDHDKRRDCFFILQDKFTGIKF